MGKGNKRGQKWGKMPIFYNNVYKTPYNCTKPGVIRKISFQATNRKIYLTILYNRYGSKGVKRRAFINIIGRSLPIVQNGKIYLPIGRLERYFSDNTRFCTVIRCLGRRSAVVKRVEHISTIVLVNIWVAQVRVPLVLSDGIWICKKLNYQCLTTSVAVVLVVRWYFNGELVLFCVHCCMCRNRLSSPRCRSELIDSAWVVTVPGQKCIKKKL